MHAWSSHSWNGTPAMLPHRHPIRRPHHRCHHQHQRPSMAHPPLRTRIIVVTYSLLLIYSHPIVILLPTHSSSTRTPLHMWTACFNRSCRHRHQNISHYPSHPSFCTRPRDDHVPSRKALSTLLSHTRTQSKLRHRLRTCSGESHAACGL